MLLFVLLLRGVDRNPLPQKGNYMYVFPLHYIYYRLSSIPWHHCIIYYRLSSIPWHHVAYRMTVKMSLEALISGSLFIIYIHSTIRAHICVLYILFGFDRILGQYKFGKCFQVQCNAEGLLLN